MKVEIELPEIEGYEYTGEYRNARPDDYYASGRIAVQPRETTLYSYFILRPVTKWIVPDANTPIGVKARFCDNSTPMDGAFCGMNPVRGSRFPFLCVADHPYPLGYQKCEVLYPYEKVDTKAND